MQFRPFHVKSPEMSCLFQIRSMSDPEVSRIYRRLAHPAHPLRYNLPLWKLHPDISDRRNAHIPAPGKIQNHRLPQHLPHCSSAVRLPYTFLLPADHPPPSAHKLCTFLLLLPDKYHPETMPVPSVRWNNRSPSPVPGSRRRYRRSVSFHTSRHLSQQK